MSPHQAAHAPSGNTPPSPASPWRDRQKRGYQQHLPVSRPQRPDAPQATRRPLVLPADVTEAASVRVATTSRD